MKQNNLLRTVLFIAAAGLFFACKKDSSQNGSSTLQTDLQSQADDQAQVSQEDDEVSNDANTVIYSQVSLTGTSSYQGSYSSGITENSTTSVNQVHVPIILPGLICDATVTLDSLSDPRTVTITYNGTNCRGNRTRTGVVILSIPAGVHWRDAGAAVTITIQNLKITRIRDNKSITINGSKTITNVTGGRLVDLASLGSITHTITGDLSVTFDNGSQRTWSVSKQRVFSYDNGIVITTTGTHTDGSTSGIAEWGTNRNGVSFSSQITTPKVIRQDCDFRLVSGENVILRGDNYSSTITYGLDASGNPTSCPGSGTYYFKVVVTKANGNILTKILPY